ncbi:HtaA domain-containing protein [Nocardioides mangrovi]|uniref:HtaA domain-containing protein n=1 Tax=Nocardioides mangrovi TaxID=2874580 RepID=UPI0021E154BA|nr:HtaA domain-containing protein [Nocardioides mangrovi]
MSTIRRIAATTSLALAAAGLGVAVSPPASAADGPTLQWGVSEYLHAHLTTQSFTDGATAASDGVVTFTDGVADGDTIHYQGAARYAFAAGGVEYYSFTFSDLQLTVDDAGDGTIGADVAWTSPSGPGSLDDVALAAFSTDDDWSDGSLTGTPDWTGVAPADTYGSGKPVDGASWAVGFVQALPSSLNPTFYASGSSSDATKAPSAFTAVAEAKTLDATASYDASGVTFAAVGSGGFTGTDGNPGDAGIYVGLAPSGGLPDVSTQDAMDNFAAAAYVPTAAVTDGGFSTSLTALASDLKKGTSYSLYTWRAHSHSTTSQDTETPVSIRWSTITLKLGAKVKGGKLVVTGTGKNGKPVGTASVKLTRKGATKTVKAVDFKNGKATVKLPKLAKGTWKAKVTYTGDNYLTAKKKVSVKR